jgi:hypothetical protein
MTKISNTAACRVMLFAWTAIFIATSEAETLEVSSAPAQEAIAGSINAALQGDGRRASQALLQVPRSQFSSADARYRRCMLQRFDSGAASPPFAGKADDPAVSGLLAIYESYWWHSLMAPSIQEQLSQQLLREVSQWLGAPAPLEDWDELEAKASDLLRQHGYHSQFGLTPPLRELMIWRKQTSAVREVELPDGSYQVRVELLDDFLTKGWSAYARCERGSNGGWADSERLYAVMPTFKKGVDDEGFRASLLGHEGQHFADLARFSDLQPWELEYRAKFAELWMAKESLRDLLVKFSRTQGDEPDSPHTFANKRVLRALRVRLQEEGISCARDDLLDVPANALRTAARDALLQDTAAREQVRLSSSPSR